MYKARPTCPSPCRYNRIWQGTSQERPPDITFLWNTIVHAHLYHFPPSPKAIRLMWPLYICFRGGLIKGWPLYSKTHHKRLPLKKNKHRGVDYFLVQSNVKTQVKSQVIHENATIWITRIFDTQIFLCQIYPSLHDKKLALKRFKATEN